MSTSPTRIDAAGDFFTDAGQADHLARTLIQGQYIWVPELGWLTWTGTHWAEIHEAQVIEQVKRHTRAQFQRAAKALSGNGDVKVVDGWRSMLSARRMSATLGLTRGVDGILVKGEALDLDRHLVNLADGTLDLHTAEVRPHDRRDRLTMICTAGLGDTGRDLWLPFLKRIQPDPEVRAFLQRLMGSALLGEVREHVMPILNGEGANGKGAFRSAILHALGPYGLEVDPAILIQTKHARHLTFLLELRGKRVVFCSETSKGAKFSDSEMKRLVGADPIQANRMRHDPITFLPSHTLIMVTNHLPEIDGEDEANWRRVLVVPFDVVIPPEERDPELPERLRLAAPAILEWLRDGWLEYQRVGLCPPEAVRLRTQKYREDNDALVQFLAERCLRSPAATIRPRELFEAWSRWCLKNGHVPGTEKALTAALLKRGLTKAGRAWSGICLYAEDEEPEDDEETDDRRLYAA